MFKVVGLFYHLQFLNSVIATLPPPVNLSFISENLHHVLMWEAGTETPSNTLYTVQYLALSTLGMETSVNQTDDEEIAWLAAENCSLITNQTCDLTNDFTNIYESYFARVKAVTEMDESNWTFSDEFQPFDRSKIRPVNFHLSEDPIGILKINFDIPSIPPSIPGFGFKSSLLTIHSSMLYHIKLFKNGLLEKNRDVLGETMNTSVEQVTEVQPNTHYCVTITVFIYEEDQSDPLEKKCIATRYMREDKEPQTSLLTILCIFGVGLAIGIVVLCKGGYLGSLGKYAPKALSNLKHIHPSNQSNNMQVKISTLEPINFREEKKIENIEEDSEEELMSSYQETGYEQNSLMIPVQNSAQSSSTCSEGETDETSTVSCDQLCDSSAKHFFTNLNDSQLDPTDMMQNEIPDAETTSQAQTAHSRKSSSASANVNVSNVPLWSIQIQDSDSCFVDLSNEKMFDQEADEPNPAEPDDLNDSLLPKDDAVISQYENPSLYNLPVISSSPQVLHSDYMRR